MTWATVTQGETYRLISASGGCLVPVGAGVYEHGLFLTHEPGGEVLAVDLGCAPGEGVALESELAKLVARRIEPGRKLAGRIRRVRGPLDV